MSAPAASPATLQAAIGVQPTPAVLDRSHVYIFPSRAGGLYMLTLVVMLVGSINYNSSLGYALTFLLASLFFTALLHTYRNLAGLRYGGGRAMAVFAGDEARFNLTLDNRGNATRHAIALRGAAQHRRWPTRIDQPADALVDLPARKLTSTELRRIAERRGWLAAGRIEIHTQFPLGLFTAWSYLHPALQCLVYPRPAGALPLPLAADAEMEEGGRRTGVDDFAGFRDYRLGDSPRHIAWKALAREQGLHVKKFFGGQAGEIVLHLSDTAGLGDLETQLSQLCKWVLEADALNLAYALRLPGTAIAPGCGVVHREQCLQALALYSHA